ncbi:mannosyltransferase [Streptomyces sp. SAI-135]|uniref:glycosyltransferase family 39 protein n=1 Tax=unclassified Streptomyces TaxID=2593676 RepID=UPI0024757380|nr:MULTISPECIES: glycosyltransferase family 39 protein [unclassified Streptomyces]MDH6555022.1 mannosyltransferase [Streptomyces sp. SAI-041]MDH6574288.1 mannosyltransferase [Streptomyces sp. SAI-117]MDH6580980.1 mannosyltransferase [Streptomyces sp. SAI-133]MDH6612987.1 mannosyltransferase [Streptomyces sp. SAI-135]
MTGRRTVGLAPAALMLALGLWGIQRQGSMGRDESTTVQVAHRSLPDLWHMLGNVDAVHGLYYLLMHALFAVWDGGLLALRLPSLLAMALAASAVGLTGRALAGPQVGLAAGLCFPLLPAVQMYAQDGRSYALVCALVAWSGHLLLRAVRRPGAVRWTLYAAVSGLACVLHEFAVLAVAAHGVTLFAARMPRALCWSWARAACCAVLPMLPLAVISQQQDAQVSWIEQPSMSQVLLFGGIAVLGAVCAGGPAPAFGRIQLPTFALPLLVLPSLTLIAVSVCFPLYAPRYTLYSQTALALTLGAAVDAVARRAVRRGPSAVGETIVLGATAVAALVPFWLPLRTPEVHLDDPAGAARAVRELAEPGDGVLFMPSGRRESKQSHPGDYRGLKDLALDQDPVSSGTLNGIELPAWRIPPRMADTNRIILVIDTHYRTTDNSEQGRVKRAYLKKHFTACTTRNAHGLRVILYARSGRCS